MDAQTGDGLAARDALAFAHLRERVALGRAIRDEAARVVADRGALAEAAAWARARIPGQSEAERAFCEAVAARVSRIFAFVGCERRH